MKYFVFVLLTALLLGIGSYFQIRSTENAHREGFVKGCEMLYYEIYQGLSLEKPGSEIFHKDCQERATKAGY